MRFLCGVEGALERYVVLGRGLEQGGGYLVVR